MTRKTLYELDPQARVCTLYRRPTSRRPLRFFHIRSYHILTTSANYEVGRKIEIHGDDETTYTILVFSENEERDVVQGLEMCTRGETLEPFSSQPVGLYGYVWRFANRCRKKLFSFFSPSEGDRKRSRSARMFSRRDVSKRTKIWRRLPGGRIRDAGVIGLTGMFRRRRNRKMRRAKQTPQFVFSDKKGAIFEFPSHGQQPDPLQGSFAWSRK